MNTHSNTSMHAAHATRLIHRPTVAKHPFSRLTVTPALDQRVGEPLPGQTVVFDWEETLDRLEAEATIREHEGFANDLGLPTEIKAQRITPEHTA